MNAWLKNKFLPDSWGIPVFTMGLAWTALATLVGCSPDTISVPNAKNEPVIYVNKDEITVESLDREMNRLKKSFRVNDKNKLKPEEELLLKTKAMSHLVHNTLLLQEVQKNGVFVTPEEFQEELFIAKSGYEENPFQKFLELEGIAVKEWEMTIKNNMLIKKLIDRMVNSKVNISEEELRKYFEVHKQELHTPKKVKALHIIVKTEEEARHIQKQLKQKKKDFSGLAQEFSLGPEGRDGGDLGYFEAGQMPPEFDKVFDLEIYQTSGIIETPYGFHLFKVVDKTEDIQMDFGSARNIIHDRLIRERREEAFQIWLVDLKAKSNIKIQHDVFSSIH